MFYSHQLLSKKGPLGHIWMAATMRNKLTRKRAESLDIQELCMQVLHPQVPLALRLSGILMGGIVAVYNRKVTFLYDDVQQLLSKVQVAIAEEKRGSRSVDLPRSKLFAKFGTITIDYTFENFDDIEQLMLRPDTPLQDGDPKVEFEEDTIVLPKIRRSNALANFSENGDENRYAGANQAHNADITLQEDLPHYKEMNDRDFEDERFAPVDDFFQDFQFPDFVIPEPAGLVEDYNEVPIGTSEGRASGDLPAGTGDAMDPEGSSDTPVNGAPVASTEDNATPENPAEEPIPPPEVAPKSPEPQSVPPRSRKRRARNTSRILDFDNGTTIPADTLRVWLQDASDLVGRETGVKATPEQTHFETLLKLPSTGLTWRSCTDEPRSLWPPCLLDLWTLNIRGRMRSRLAEQEEKDDRSPSDGTPRPEDQDLGKPVPVTTAGRKGSEPENELSGSHDSNMQPPAEEPATQGAPAPEAPVMEVPTDLEKFQEYGSVEKLRQALHTPASQDDTGNEMGFTPSVSGSHEEGQGSGWPKRRRSTPVSAGLKLDPDIQLPTSERSKGSKRRRSYIFGKSDSPKSDSPAIPGDNNAPDFMIPSNGLDSLAIPGSVSQFELQVDTNPSTQVTDPKQSMDTVTTQLVQFLKDHFHSTNAPRWQSLNELTAGLERFQAAKLFYQITVLTSNRYLIIQQEEAYGDILIAPGQYL